jgi:acyl-CoA synthetase (NDP forming)
MVSGGVELIVGISRDDRFGPLILFGMGGLTAELQHDVVLRIPPITDVDIAEMIKGLRGSPLLFGYRNSPVVDTTKLSDVLARISRLSEEIPEIAELDCNPLIVSTDGALVVDAKVRLAPDSRPRSACDID